MGPQDDAGYAGGRPDEQPGAAGASGATNFVLFDFRALTTFDERRPHVVTLAETGAARLLLVMLRAGQTLAPRPLASEVSAQALRGRLRLTVGGVAGVAGVPPSTAAASIELRAGRLAQIEAQTSWRFDALGDAVILLSLTPSPGDAALDDALRGVAGPLVMRA
jgi:quercetin dioxygenase-like cupin family protein